MFAQWKDHALAQPSTDGSYEQRENQYQTFDKRPGAYPLGCFFAADTFSNKQIAGNVPSCSKDG